MSDRYQIVEQVATLTAYRELCIAVGWEGVMNFQAAETALPNSLYGLVATCENEIVGMGRVFAAEGTELFYERYGFQEHPALQGMFQVVPD